MTSTRQRTKNTNSSIKSRMLVGSTAKSRKIKSGNFCYRLLFVITFLFFASVAAVLFVLPDLIDPLVVELEAQPAPIGPLAFNKLLADATRIWTNQLVGPESFAFDGDVMYTGTVDGNIWKINLVTMEALVLTRFGHENCTAASACSRPLGMRINPKDGRLLVVDAYLGLYSVDTASGMFNILIGPENPIGVTFFDDLDVLPDGSAIFISEASQKFPLHEMFLNFIEMGDNGRLIRFDTATTACDVVMSGLRFANGVQLHPDGVSVLVAELTHFRIQRYYFAGPRTGQSEVFVSNLALVPDNIRLSTDRRSLWISSAVTRFAGQWSVLDTLADKPWARSFVAKLPEKLFVVTSNLQRHGAAMRLDVNSGAILEILHDPNGVSITDCSEVQEHNGYLYFASYKAPYAARLKL